MNVIIPKKRRDGGTSFNKLVSYISDRVDQPDPDEPVTDKPKPRASQSRLAQFDRLVDYIERGGSENEFITVLDTFPDGTQRLLCGGIACETNCFSWETAAAEMNMVAAQNARCKDPVYHFILSWREEENPTPAQVFESVRHCISVLGMERHQYVTAIHTDTDNLHCHVAVNRVNPSTYRAANLWNDADTLQKACRVLERRYGFLQDNGSWTWGANDQLVRVDLKFKPAPSPAGALQAHGDQESLYHYAKRSARESIDKALVSGPNTWDHIHLVLHEKGLGLREAGLGLQVYDAIRPDSPGLKASSVHPMLTKAKLEPTRGSFQGPPKFDSGDSADEIFGVFQTYTPAYRLRDQGMREDRRAARAEAREALRERYQKYRDSFRKPDLQAEVRRQHISLEARAHKEQIKSHFRDPLLRKLMYHRVEFERMKAMAELRIQLRRERQVLTDLGLYRPLSYRLWVEQEALKGDVAAVSQLRGFTYRERRQARLNAKVQDRVILCGPADDAPVCDMAHHATLLRRNGTVEYLRGGQPGVVDYGDRIEIKPGFEDRDDEVNLYVATELVSLKKGEPVLLKGDDRFIDRALVTAAYYHAMDRDFHYRLADDGQRVRAQMLEDSEVRLGQGQFPPEDPRCHPGAEANPRQPNPLPRPG